MGTLFNQPVRSRENSYGLEDEITYIQTLAKDYKISFSEVVALMDVLERKRSNNLAVNDGDVHDEQIAGLGEILDRIATALEELSDK